MKRKQQRFEIAADKEPGAVALDPNTWVLMDAHFVEALIRIPGEGIGVSAAAKLYLGVLGVLCG